jgi:hypothetical protein
LLSRLKASLGYQTKPPAISSLLAMSTVSRRAEIANGGIGDRRHQPQENDAMEHACHSSLVGGTAVFAVRQIGSASNPTSPTIDTSD